MQDDPILDLKATDLGSGLFPGWQVSEVPLWQDALNVDFDIYGVHSCAGFALPTINTALFDSAAGNFDSAAGLFDDAALTPTVFSTGVNVPITGLLTQYLTDRTRRIIYCTKTNIYFYEGGTAASVGSGYAGFEDETLGNKATRWSLVGWGDWVIAANGEDPVQIYKTGPTFSDLANTPFTTAEILLRYGPHLIAVNTSNGDNMIEWCAEDNPEAWDPVTFPTAGNLPVRGLSGPFTCAAPLNDFWLLYTDAEVRSLRYVGGVFIFGEFPAIKGVGAVSKNSVISMGPRNYGITREGIFVADGASFKIISDEKFGRFLNSTINWEQRSKIAGYHDRISRQIRWALPIGLGTEPSMVIGFNYINNSYSFYSVPFTVGLENTILDANLIGTSGGQVAFAGLGSNDINGAPLTRRLVTKPLDIGKRNYWKFVDFVQSILKIGAGTGLQLYVGWQEKLEDPIEWLPAETLSGLSYDSFIGTSGVFWTLKWESRGADVDWQLAGVKIFGALDGKVR